MTYLLNSLYLFINSVLVQTGCWAFSFWIDIRRTKNFIAVFATQERTYRQWHVTATLLTLVEKRFCTYTLDVNFHGRLFDILKLRNHMCDKKYTVTENTRHVLIYTYLF